jgi:hypothetical protein
MYRVVEGDESVKNLLQKPPFVKPRFIRALLYDYSFTSSEDRAKTGAIWQRRLLGKWCGPISLQN